MKANAVNLASFANALCHRNATPLSVAVLAPCAWGGNLVARQIRLGKCGEIGGVCECLGGGLLFLSFSLSLSLSLLALFGILTFLNTLFLGFCALFVILSLCKRATQRVARRKPQQKNPHKLKENLPFLDTSLVLSMTANASLRAVFAKTADFVILSLLQKGEKSKGLKAHLPFLDTSLTLSMTNSGFCLKITDIFTQILGTKFTNFTRFYGLPRSLCSLAMTARQKFKFFTQNSRHFINSTHFVNSKHFTNSIHFINFTQNSRLFTNSTHFITLSQISSPTQGFFIFLPQVFAQCKLINIILQGGHCV